MNDDPPHHLIDVALEPRPAADVEPLRAALAEAAARDRSIAVRIDNESGQLILAGSSEEDLDQRLGELIQQGLRFNVGAPQVAYRETLGRRAEIDYTHKRQAGGAGEFARVKLVFEPGGPGSGFQFESAIVGGAVPEEYIPGVRKGLESAREDGLVAGFPVIDFKAILIDGAWHDVDSSPLAFEIATRAAFRQLREKGSPKLLEPIMSLEVESAEEDLCTILGDLGGRRARILGRDIRGEATVVTATVPLSRMFGYANTLQAISQGRARFGLRFSHYGAVPAPEDGPPTFRPAMGMRA